jgi:bifunctional DNA-binding transcriptional regulator/antitoxin component of YhaV-PrlF toxin-antitoxin module
MATVGERFQVVIERDARRELGVRPGDRAVETVENGRLVITFLPARHRRSLLGSLAGAGPAVDASIERDTMADSLAQEDAERGR